jgi:hypothetical protein
MLRHQFAEEGQTVHARHLDIEGDHVGHFFADAFGGGKRIGGGAHDFDPRVGG